MIAQRLATSQLRIFEQLCMKSVKMSFLPEPPDNLEGFGGRRTNRLWTTRICARSFYSTTFAKLHEQIRTMAMAQSPTAARRYLGRFR